MPRRYVAEWQWDEANIEELAKHGISPDTVYEIFEEAPRYRLNRKGRAATHRW